MTIEPRVAELYRRYCAGESTRDLAASLGVTMQRISQLLKRHPNYAPYENIRKENLEAAKDAVSRRLTAAQFAKEQGRGYDWACSWMRRVMPQSERIKEDIAEKIELVKQGRSARSVCSSHADHMRLIYHMKKMGVVSASHSRWQKRQPHFTPSPQEGAKV